MAELTTGAASLERDLRRTGYHPALIGSLAERMLGDEELRAHLVHCEAVLDPACVGRHVTVLLLTPTRFIAIHVDDHDGSDSGPHGFPAPEGDAAVAMTVSEVVPLAQVNHVRIHQVIPSRETAAVATEVILVIGWAGRSDVSLGSAPCDNPDCEGGCGWEGTLVADDLSMRLSAAGDGPDATARALDFASAVAQAVGR